MKNKKYRPATRKRTMSKRYVVVGFVVVILAGLGYLGYHHYHHSGKIMPQYLRGAGQATKGQPTQQTNPSSSSSTQSSSSTAGKTGSSATTSPTTPLQTPTGNFVSNHHVSFSNPASDNITSVCNTTPGASCKITFTDGSTVHSLPTETADADGSAFWTNWKLEQIGITVGTWKITAVATLGSQTASASDALTLDVTQ